jgi:hypothetical protein
MIQLDWISACAIISSTNDFSAITLRNFLQHSSMLDQKENEIFLFARKEDITN